MVSKPQLSVIDQAIESFFNDGRAAELKVVRPPRIPETSEVAFQEDGINFHHWANISHGSIFLYVVERFAKYETFMLRLHNPADHGPFAALSRGATSVYVSTADWPGFHEAVMTFLGGILVLPERARRRLLLPDSKSSQDLEDKFSL